MSDQLVRRNSAGFLFFSLYELKVYICSRVWLIFTFDKKKNLFRLSSFSCQAFLASSIDVVFIIVFTVEIDCFLALCSFDQIFI